MVCGQFLQTGGEGPYPHLSRRLLRHTYIGTPNGVGIGNVESAEKVGVNLMSGMGFRETGLLVEGLYAHLSHEGTDMGSSYFMAFM